MTVGDEEIDGDDNMAVLQPSFDRERREEQLDTFEPDFDDLDTRLYDLEQDGALEARILAYVRAHRHAFYHPPRSLLGGDDAARRP